MTKRFDLYGSRLLSLDDAARRLEAALGLVIQRHDSSYRGGDYYRGSGDAVEEVIVQQNFEDEEGYLAEPDFPDHEILVYVTEPNELGIDRLRDLTDLTLLRSRVL
ncbi:MAG: hypothetical protein ACRDTC_23915 [Pseudonocardiaceae bacterium]